MEPMKWLSNLKWVGSGFPRLAAACLIVGTLMSQTASAVDILFTPHFKTVPMVSGNVLIADFTADQPVLDSVSLPSYFITANLDYSGFTQIRVGTVNLNPGDTTFRLTYVTDGRDSANYQTVAASNAASNGNTYTVSNQFIRVNPADVAAVGADKSSLSPFDSTVGTVILNGVAGPSGRVVTLTSDNPVISVPPSVMVPAGQRRASFIIRNVSNVIVGGTAKITAQIGAGASASKNISYNDFRQVSITPSVTSIVGGNPLGFLVTTNASLPAMTALGFEWGGTATGSFPTLVQFPAGRKTVGFSVVPDGVDSAQTLTVKGLNNSDPMPTASVQVLPATLVGVRMNSTFGGTRGTGSVTLNGFAGPSGVDILLDAVAYHASFPAFVTIPPNQRSATFTYTTSGTDTDEVINLMAYQGSTMVTSSGTVRSATASALIPSVTTTAGGRVLFTLRLSGATGMSGVTFTLNSSDPSVVVPSSVQVLPGRSSITFVGTATSTGTPTPVTITATGPSGVGSAGTTITVN